jgi:hypothetical protein
MEDNDELITKVPKFKMINYGEDFEKWGDARKISYLKKLASSMNNAADLMQQERNAIAVQMDTVNEQMSNVESNLAIQKNIVLKVITESNEANQNHITRIQELENMVRKQADTIETLEIQLQAQV